MSSFLSQSGAERGDIQTSFGKYDIIWAAWNWIYANVYCQLSGGHLATFETQEEFNAINFTQHTEEIGYGKLWIGLNDILTEGKYVWNYTGQAPSYSAWDINQPSQSTDDTDCGTVYGRNNKWSIHPCSTLWFSLCEYP